MRWFNRYNFPYSNFHDLNLDWIIKEMNRLIEEWEQLKAEWEQMKIEWAEFQAEMQRLWEDYKALMNAAWEAYKAQMNQEWADYKDEMDAAWDAYQAELNAQWLAYQNNLNAAWEAYRTSLNNSWDAYQTTMNTWKDGVDQDIQDKFDEIDEKCRQCKADVDAAIATLNGLLASVQQQVTDYLNNLNYEPIIRDATNDWLDEHGVTVNYVYVTPEEHGAVGDGTTDDSAAFNAAFLDCQNTGKPLFLSKPSYFLDSDNVTTTTGIMIFGNDSYIKLRNVTSTFTLNTSATAYNLKVNCNLNLLGVNELYNGDAYSFIQSSTSTGNIINGLRLSRGVSSTSLISPVELTDFSGIIDNLILGHSNYEQRIKVSNNTSTVDLILNNILHDGSGTVGQLRQNVKFNITQNGILPLRVHITNTSTTAADITKIADDNTKTFIELASYTTV